MAGRRSAPAFSPALAPRAKRRGTRQRRLTATGLWQQTQAVGAEVQGLGPAGPGVAWVAVAPPAVVLPHGHHWQQLQALLQQRQQQQFAGPGLVHAVPLPQAGVLSNAVAQPLLGASAGLPPGQQQWQLLQPLPAALVPGLARVAPAAGLAPEEPVAVLQHPVQQQQHDVPAARGGAQGPAAYHAAAGAGGAVPLLAPAPSASAYYYSSSESAVVQPGKVMTCRFGFQSSDPVRRDLIAAFLA